MCAIRGLHTHSRIAVLYEIHVNMSRVCCTRRSSSLFTHTLYSLYVGAGHYACFFPFVASQKKKQNKAKHARKASSHQSASLCLLGFGHHRSIPMSSFRPCTRSAYCTYIHTRPFLHRRLYTALGRLRRQLCWDRGLEAPAGRRRELPVCVWHERVSPIIQSDTKSTQPFNPKRRRTGPW